MLFRTTRQILFLCVSMMVLAPTVALAQQSQFASAWSVNNDADWTPFPPNAAPLGGANNSCTGGVNSNGWAEFTFPAFSVSDPITGIEVNVKYLSASGTNGVVLRKSDSVVGSKTLPVHPGTSFCSSTFFESVGGAGDTWTSGLTAADFNSGSVSVRINQDANTIEIDAVELIVYFSGANSDPDCSGATISSPRNANASCQAVISGSDVTGVTDPDPGDTLTIGVSPTTLSLGSNMVTISADDGNGGTCSKMVSVDVVDETNPMVMCPSNMNLNANASCEATYSSPTASATDNCPGVSVSSSPSLPETFAGVGDNVITYTATDANGNMASCMQTVTLKDVTPPVITLNGSSPVTLECNVDAYSEPGATAADNCDMDVMVVVGGDTVDPGTKGTYTVTYNATDDSSNAAAQVERTVEVEDTIPPVVTLNGSAMVTLECAVDTYVDLGATATDICDGMLPAPAMGTVDESTPGTYEIDYTATDGEGLSDTKTRTVVVQDTLPPEITVSTDRFVLWPPNHKYHTIDLVDVVTDASDLCDLTISAADVVLAEVASDEPENGKGDGNTVDDIVIAPVDCRSVDLRAERQGKRNGRVYTLDLEATDAGDNVGTASSQVEVPHDKKDTAVDDGPAYSEVSDCASFKALMQCEGALDKAQFERSIDAKGHCMAGVR